MRGADPARHLGVPALHRERGGLPHDLRPGRDVDTTCTVRRNIHESAATKVRAHRAPDLLCGCVGRSHVDPTDAWWWAPAVVSGAPAAETEATEEETRYPEAEPLPEPPVVKYASGRGAPRFGAPPGSHQYADRST